jgi:hypothetical protein
MGRTGKERSVMRPVVTEIPRALEPVTRDPFIDGLDGAPPLGVVVDLEEARRLRAAGPHAPSGEEAA